MILIKSKMHSIKLSIIATNLLSVRTIDNYEDNTLIELSKNEVYELITKLQELHNLMS